MVEPEITTSVNSADGTIVAPVTSSPATPEFFDHICSVDQHAILIVLNEPEFAPQASRVFAGFRVGPSALKRPLVRGRILIEMARNSLLSDRLLAIPVLTPVGATFAGDVEALPPNDNNLDGRQTTEAIELQDKLSDVERIATQLRADRDKRRRERDTARERLNEANDVVTALKLTLSQEMQAHHSAKAQLEKLLTKQERLERQLSRLKGERDLLLTAARSSKGQGTISFVNRAVAPRTLQSNDLKNAPPIAEAWADALRRLTDRNELEAVAALCGEMLVLDPENETVLRAAIRLEQIGGLPATAFVRTLFNVVAKRGYSAELTEVLAVFATSPANRELQSLAAIWARLITSVSIDEWRAARAIMSRVGATNPKQYETLRAILSKIAGSKAALAVLPEPGALDVDTPLPIPKLNGATAASLVSAVRGNNSMVVEHARTGLSALKSASLSTYGRVLDVLRAGAGDDKSLIEPLIGKTSGPVVVDASNVAWFEQEHLVAGRPRLMPIVQLVRALRSRGFFPVVVYGDAPLPFTIDRADQLNEMIESKQILLVDSGIDADEYLVREAKRLGAPLVTNDRMIDWDPLGEVNKIRFVVSHTGTAQLLFAPRTSPS